MKTRIVILGSTGSIGRKAVDIIRRFSDRFELVGLSCHQNIEMLAEQVQQTRPKFVGIQDQAAWRRFQAVYPQSPDCTVISGPTMLRECAAFDGVDLVVSAVVGMCGLGAALTAVEHGRQLLLANKESLVSGGELITRLARAKQIPLIPIDSELTAIFQCLHGESAESARRIIITGSGGPFRDTSAASLKNVTIADALAHPVWKMGRKISIDSATLMNKGFELIASHWVFGVPVDQIEITIHRQGLVHALLEFHDGSVKALLSYPDMALAIQYALTYPERCPLSQPEQYLDFRTLGSLTFESPDLSRFPCLAYAIDAIKQGGLAPAFLNAANEAAVSAFLDNQIRFLDIPRIIGKVIAKTPRLEYPAGLAEIAQADLEARNLVESMVRRKKIRRESCSPSA
jgi:1-deoxy-D-xylulose-5-phosphate reductoisomerase